MGSMSLPVFRRKWRSVRVCQSRGSTERLRNGFSKSVSNGIEKKDRGSFPLLDLIKVAKNVPRAVLDKRLRPMMALPWF